MLREDKQTGKWLIENDVFSLQELWETVRPQEGCVLSTRGTPGPDTDLLAGGYCVQPPPQYCQ